MVKQTRSNFHFGGRYTLREINGNWSIYDRELQSLAPFSPSAHTFTKAKVMLENWKKVKEVI